MDVAGRAVDDHGVARIGDAGGVGDLAHRRDAERARHDRHVRRRAAFLQDEAAQPPAVVVEQRRRAHRAGDHDGIFRESFTGRRMFLAGELAHQPIGEIVEIVQPFAQIGIGNAQHPRAGVGLHAFDRGLGGEAGSHRFVEPVLPAAVIGEHAIGFEHVPVLAAVGDLAAFEQDVEVRAHGLDRRLEALELLRDVVGDEIGDHHARLVQHDMTERDAVIERDAGQMQRPPGGWLQTGLGDGGKLARGDHLGQHHRGGLQRLLFLLGIGPARAVLHHQHAERIAGAQHRHAEEGVVDLLAGLGPEREGGVVLGVRKVDRVRLARDEPDQALVRAQHGLVDGFRLEAFAGVQFERAVHAQHVDGADLRHHVGGDQHHDLVQAFLRADRLRHHLAKPAQQHARTAERATHDVILGSAHPAGAGWAAGATKSGNSGRRAQAPAAATIHHAV